MALRSSELGTEKLISLLGTSLSGSVSHLSNVSLVQVILDFCNAGEYWNDATEPAARPYTPASDGPSLSRSRAWQPPQRFSKVCRPAVCELAIPRNRRKAEMPETILSSPNVLGSTRTGWACSVGSN